jgi:signal transduction histidine kinase
MKRRIIIGLTIFSLIFFLGGIYIVITIEKTTSTLDNLIRLHQVEILREQLLIDVKRVQTDLAFKHTQYARELDTVVSNVIQMGKEANKCLGCHHSTQINEKITDLKNQIQIYKDSLSRIITTRANIKRLEAEESMAFRIGQELIIRLNNMTSLTKAKLEQKTRSSLKEIAEMKTLLFILIALGPLLTIGLAIIFVKGFAKPLNVLLLATRKLKTGDLNFQIQPLKYEFGELASSFNEMAGSLKDQMYKMQRAEQMTTFGQMAAGLVHEIKNPLAGIKAAIELMAEEITLSAENKDILTLVISEVRRIEALMKSLLDFARPPKPQFMQVNLNHILEGTLDFLTRQPSFSQNKKKPIAIVQNLDARLPEIVADPQQLRQIFINLLLNAHEAMAQEGNITIKTSHDSSDAIEIAISDTGKGINKDLLEKIFQPFFTTKPKGTGLGLAISKQLVEQHGGTISVENNPDGGATFRIKIPITQPERIPG